MGQGENRVFELQDKAEKVEHSNKGKNKLTERYESWFSKYSWSYEKIKLKNLGIKEGDEFLSKGIEGIDFWQNYRRKT